MAKERSRVLFMTGNVNALDFGGGVVYKTKHGITWEGWETDDEGPNVDEDGKQIVFEVFRIGLDEDRTKDNWIKWGDVANAVGMDVDELKELAASKDPKDRFIAVDAVIAYYGMREFDDYPVVLTRAELKRRWRTQLKG